MRIAAALALVLGLAACRMDVTPEERRWHAIDGHTVYVASGYSTLVHGKKDCPDLAKATGEVKTCTVKGTRLVDAEGNYVGSERERQPLCPTCVK